MIEYVWTNEFAQQIMAERDALRAEVERAATISSMRIGELDSEIERLKTELADTKRVYGTKGSTNEQKWEMLEKHCEGLEGAIREALYQFEIIGGSGRYPVAMEILRKAVGQ